MIAVLIFLGVVAVKLHLIEGSELMRLCKVLT